MVVLVLLTRLGDGAGQQVNDHWKSNSIAIPIPIPIPKKANPNDELPELIDLLRPRDRCIGNACKRRVGIALSLSARNLGVAVAIAH